MGGDRHCRYHLGSPPSYKSGKIETPRSITALPVTPICNSAVSEEGPVSHLLMLLCQAAAIRARTGDDRAPMKTI